VSETENMTDAELAEQYNRTKDLSEFGDTEPVEIRRSVTISVRFSQDEIDELRHRADAADVKITAFIRSAALAAGRPIDRDIVTRLATQIEQQAHALREAVG
jgi:hypothetical protein